MEVSAQPAALGLADLVRPVALAAQLLGEQQGVQHRPGRRGELVEHALLAWLERSAGTAPDADPSDVPPRVADLDLACPWAAVSGPGDHVLPGHQFDRCAQAGAQGVNDDLGRLPQ